jgi:hypothetical protein
MGFDGYLGVVDIRRKGSRARVGALSWIAHNYLVGKTSRHGYQRPFENVEFDVRLQSDGRNRVPSTFGARGWHLDSYIALRVSARIWDWALARSLGVFQANENPTRYRPAPAIARDFSHRVTLPPCRTRGAAAVLNLNSSSSPVTKGLGLSTAHASRLRSVSRTSARVVVSVPDRA